ncbi:glycine cleavage system aminomethyltransferase GcvT [Beijerinckia indica]|uniref:aminomethyltransferase n=1 Tax=Beijerinckia indica subsp. indica (strain ATCC 9039 / DSM 1715 / NCIMB 8712) TaxID=395963 RepID=B2IGK1_BEII9|nr:glycine cleavage system aminomethyltransferase GcvT [Beijerinckia indica]ACB94383.1 glycine cleavage system T protein [Beijerinckia indica subsp. indica ATCC 9039]
MSQAASASDTSGSTPALLHTPLYALHCARGARMVPFACYAMPVQYPTGILEEHLHTRAKAGLFDVSHMGQALLEGQGAAARLETLVPGDLTTLAPGRMRYTQLLNPEGGILDDLMVTRLADDAAGERLFLVVNAATKAQDFAHIGASLPDLRLTLLEDRALLALQGPSAATVLAKHFPAVATMPFMSLIETEREGALWRISRSGYTGEDGFEIAVPAGAAEAFAETLLGDEEVWPIGLGARDSLRLEAGLCLYGHDIDPITTPIEAGLLWSISKRRREGGGFPGAARVQREIAEGPARRRVGLKIEGKIPAREGAKIETLEGEVIGLVTSGGFAPSLGAPIAMGYVASAHAANGTALQVIVRGKPLAATITSMPFVPNHYYRGA